MSQPTANGAGEPVSNKQRRRQDRAALLALLREMWPLAFAKPWPLKIGVHVEIHAALAGIATPVEIGYALMMWTRSPAYLGRLAQGRRRIGLDGSLGEPATAEERRHAAELIAQRLQRKAAP